MPSQKVTPSYRMPKVPHRLLTRGHHYVDGDEFGFEYDEFGDPPIESTHPTTHPSASLRNAERYPSNEPAGTSDNDDDDNTMSTYRKINSYRQGYLGDHEGHGNDHPIPGGVGWKEAEKGYREMSGGQSFYYDEGEGERKEEGSGSGSGSGSANGMDMDYEGMNIMDDRVDSYADAPQSPMYDPSSGTPVNAQMDFNGDTSGNPLNIPSASNSANNDLGYYDHSSYHPLGNLFAPIPSNSIINDTTKNPYDLTSYPSSPNQAFPYASTSTSPLGFGAISSNSRNTHNNHRGFADAYETTPRCKRTFKDMAGRDEIQGRSLAEGTRFTKLKQARCFSLAGAAGNQEGSGSQRGDEKYISENICAYPQVEGAGCDRCEMSNTPCYKLGATDCLECYEVRMGKDGAEPERIVCSFHNV